MFMNHDTIRLQSYFMAVILQIPIYRLQFINVKTTSRFYR